MKTVWGLFLAVAMLLVAAAPGSAIPLCSQCNCTMGCGLICYVDGTQDLNYCRSTGNCFLGPNCPNGPKLQSRQTASALTSPAVPFEAKVNGLIFSYDFLQCGSRQSHP
jgi:hypothetical protein